MLAFTVTLEGPTPTQVLADVRDYIFNLRPLAEQVAEVARRQNEDARSAGLDRDGVPYVPLAPATMKRRVRQGRLGPPLAPDGGGSPIATGFRAEVVERTPYDLDVVCNWPSVPWAGFHNDLGDARTHLPVRDSRGLTPAAHAEVVDALNEFVARVAR
jgi:hypothetical protein